MNAGRRSSPMKISALQRRQRPASRADRVQARRRSSTSRTPRMVMMVAGLALPEQVVDVPFARSAVLAVTRIGANLRERELKDHPFRHVGRPQRRRAPRARRHGPSGRARWCGLPARAQRTCNAGPVRRRAPAARQRRPRAREQIADGDITNRAGASPCWSPVNSAHPAIYCCPAMCPQLVHRADCGG